MSEHEIKEALNAAEILKLFIKANNLSYPCLLDDLGDFTHETDELLDNPAPVK
jgi:hypothetical protein